MAAALDTSYDRVPYQSLPFAQTHPNRLATVATLLGMNPTTVDRCRVLELGCAAGGNLLPMAAGLPGSRFVGVDLSARQIADGQKTVQALGLNNVELRHASITDVDAGYGQFDYIICHGVYSWVPPAVQDKILQVCRANLFPHGVAYVSYNTLPGWRLRGTVRDLMCYHARRFDTPDAQVRQARALLEFLAEFPCRKDGPYATLLKEELHTLKDKPDHYLLHEFLEEYNEPLYFHEFVRRATGHKLRYLGEAAMAVMAPAAFPPKAQQVLHRLAADQIQLEQYMDFLRNQQFRQTLLCHQAVPATYKVDPGRAKGMYVGSAAKPASAAPDLLSAAPEAFKLKDGTALTTSEPVMKAAMAELAAAYPRPLAFDALLERALARVGRGSAAAADAGDRLAGSLANCYTSSALVELSAQAPAYTLDVGDRPVACRLARWQAEAGGHVSNLRHEVVQLKEPERHALRHLDGTHDRAGLTDALVGLVRRGVLKPAANGPQASEAAELRATVGTFLDKTLPRFASNALLLPAGR